MRNLSALVPVALPAGADPETAAIRDSRAETAAIRDGRAETDEEGRDGDKWTGPAGDDT